MGGLFNKTREMLQDGPFLKKALMIACPVALQGMLNTIVNMVDTLMIGGLGSTAIAAVGLANKVFFVFSLLAFYTAGTDRCSVFCNSEPDQSENGHEDFYNQRKQHRTGGTISADCSHCLSIPCSYQCICGNASCYQYRHVSADLQLYCHRS